MTVTREQVDNWFTYHAPDDRQRKAYTNIRYQAKSMAYVILEQTPPSADQTAALRKLRECVMTANAAIACALGESEPPLLAIAEDLVDADTGDDGMPSGEGP